MALRIANTQATTNSGSYVFLSATNGSGNAQNAFIGATSTTGAGSYIPNIVFGTQGGASSFQERLRINGTTGNIGIGTSNNTNPGYALTLGNFSSSTIGADRSGVGVGKDVTMSAGGGQLATTNTAGGNLYLASGTATGNASSNIYLQTAGGGGSGTSDRLVATVMSILGSGNVGLGTTSPSYNLSMNGTAAQTIGVEANTAGGGNNLTILAGGAAPGATNGGGGVLALSSGATTGFGGSQISFLTSDPSHPGGTTAYAPFTRMVLDSHGRLGIGENFPNVPLEVAVLGSTLAKFKNTNSPNVGNEASVAFAAQNSAFSYTNYGEVAGGTTLQTSAAEDGYLKLSTMRAGTMTEAVRISSAGNVGIGIAPTIALDVSAKVDALRLPNGTTAQQPTAANGMLRYNITTNKLEAVENGAWANVIGGGGGTAAGATNYIQFNNAGAFAADANFQWNSSTKALSVSGASAPTIQVNDISGTLSSIPLYISQANLANGNTQSIVLGKSQNADNSGVMSYKPSGTAGANTLELSHYGHSPTLVITNGAGTAAGNVGIGTTNPQYALDVSGVAFVGGPTNNLDQNATPHADLTKLAYSGKMLFGYNYSGGAGETDYISNRQFGSEGGFHFYDYSNGNVMAHLVTIRGDGNVGIGTLSPNSALSFGGNAARTIAMERSTTATANPLTISAGGTVAGASNGNGGSLVLTSGFATGAGGSSMEFRTATPGSSGTSDVVPSTKVLIDANGSVAIGTMSPAAKLDVAGTTKLGSSGTPFSNMGVCTVAAYVPTNSVSNQTCTGIPASTSIVVNCSATAAFTTPASTVMYARATGTANQVAINLSAANSASVGFTCMWMQP